MFIRLRKFLFVRKFKLMQPLELTQDVYKRQVDGYRDAVVRACENAKAVGSARGDRAVLGVRSEEHTS